MNNVGGELSGAGLTDALPGSQINPVGMERLSLREEKPRFCQSERIWVEFTSVYFRPLWVDNRHLAGVVLICTEN
jgi:hypothetical protein